ncbi:uridine diphosphate-N-acetylglucosamine-binding protein YvcK [Pontibacillus yanchengensis]|uniref:Uridine diphosphate-N-acetylglucosamine-binding protein YvcK n=2 Tax=Pontibacillus yanchengensis TaxID=462910 RepID=A0ACC7VH46_9BACI|nr:YvcK family protein [Pontibacillus yanchengensis]MYL34037.1 uridine diphosphate-N-acetylglucosamine-binding protein YvcK [Pontibacillus yanchengensis]MYL54087.1 uridine diphosphate-N-acetylglucosamine-binding protein YvcK [Pontibacillus yanchengensis]
MTNQSLPSVVVLGGGTGMPVLLRGLKSFPIDLTAIVTVADDGGSSGRLRDELSIPAPGDIRNVIAALSDAEPMLLDLFQHRFANGNGLSGHSMGNLLLAAMTSITDDFFHGIKEISRVLNVKGNILPIANQNMYLHAVMEDGSIVSGESKIPAAEKRIKRVFLSPEPVQPLPEAVQAVKDADLVVIAPGSLYTSTLPNMIVSQIGDALRETHGKVVYVCNVMTQFGETTGYTAADHVQAIHEHIGKGCLDAILVHNKPIATDVQKLYAAENSKPVVYDHERIKKLGVDIIEGDIIDPNQMALRHDTSKVAKLLVSLIQNKKL